MVAAVSAAAAASAAGGNDHAFLSHDNVVERYAFFYVADTQCTLYALRLCAALTVLLPPPCR